MKLTIHVTGPGVVTFDGLPEVTTVTVRYDLLAETPSPDGRAYVGQVIPEGTFFSDLPKGVKWMREVESNFYPWLTVTRDGSQFEWCQSMAGKGKFEDIAGCRTVRDMIVREVW